MFFLFIFIVIGLGVFFLIADGLCTAAVKKARKRLEAYKPKELQLSSGTVTYVDRGKGDVILSIHGICGGFDQGLDTAFHLTSNYRVIAPSRFGFAGSDLPETPGVKEQARVFAELLDKLDVDNVYILAASTGSTVAIRFALDYPDRVKGLIMYSPTAPSADKPRHYAKYIGLPRFILSDYGMWLLSLFFKPLLSIERTAVYIMLPFSERRSGIINDAEVTNPDMARNYDEYPIEELRTPTLIFQARNDKLSKYKLIERSVRRFPDCKFVVFDKGGHMLSVCGEEIAKEETAFFNRFSEN